VKAAKSSSAGVHATAIHDFRTTLDELERKSQESYDKAILTLSGGALGVTISFVKDVIGDHAAKDTPLMLISWCCWGLSLLCVLFSHYFSQLALRKTIQQLDAGTLAHETPGGWMDRVTSTLNAGSGLFFLVGTFFFVFFAHSNLG